MTSYTTRAGEIKTSVFDARNREVSYTWSDGVTPNVSRTYDAAGRLLTSANGESTSTYTYDNANQLLSETQTNANLSSGWTVAYSYDLDGNKSSVTYPSGSVVNYSRTGRVISPQLPSLRLMAAGWALSTRPPNLAPLPKTKRSPYRMN